MSFMIFSGCHLGDLEFDKVKNPEISTSIAFNVGSVKYNALELMEDIEDESLEIKEGEDMSISFFYRDTTQFSNVDDLITIGTISNVESLTVGRDIPASPIEFRIPFEETFVFEFAADNNEAIDSVYFKAGSLEYAMQSDFEASIEYSWTIINTKFQETNLDISRSILLNYDGVNQVTDSFVQPLSALKALISKEGGLNVFRVHITGELIVPVGSQIRRTESMNFELTFRDPEFSGIFGNFGSDVFDVQEEEIAFDMFEEYGGDGLALGSPSVTLEVDNSFGIEMGVDLSKIVAVDNDNSEIALAGSVVDNLQIIDAPALTNVGGLVGTNIDINTTNSNIADLLNSTPNNIRFAISAQPNPPGAALTSNFVTDSAEVEIRTVIEIPLDFKMDGFTTDFDFEFSGSDIDDAESLTLRLKTTNEMPFNGSVDIQFLDANDVVLDEVLDADVIKSPVVGTDGRISQPATNSTDIVLDQDAIDAFLKSEKSKVIVKISSFEANQDRFVKIFSDYELEIALSVFGKITTQL